MHRQSQTLIVPEREASVRFAALFDGTPIEIRVTDAYLTEAWRKLGINVMANGVTALTGRPLGVFHRPGHRTARTAAAARVVDGGGRGRRRAAHLPMSTRSSPASARSTRKDRRRCSRTRRAGRPTEHDALYGAVMRAGSRLGIATPLVETVGALLAAIDDG